MAADADAPNGELSEKAAKAPSPPSSDRTDDGSPVSRDESEPTTAGEAEAADGDVDEADGASGDGTPVKPRISHVRLAAIIGLAMVVAILAMVGWLGYRGYQSHQAQDQRRLFVQVGRQCALNLTTIDWQHAEGDVQRVLDSATGQFYDQFSKRKQPFIDVVKKAQSKSVGTITEAGLESDSADKAQMLVAVSIKTSNLGAADQPPREWRMRISMEKSGGEVKVSNVAFVP